MQYKTKANILKRDNYTCVYCGYSINDMEESRSLVIDHIIPHSFGGKTNIDNSVTSCSVCNKKLLNFCPDTTKDHKNMIIEKREYLININKSVNNRNKNIYFNL